MRTLIVKQEIKFNTINNIRTYLNDRIFELRKLSYDTLLIHSIHKIFNEVNDNKISEQQIINRFCCKMPISNLYEDKIIQTFQINIPNVSG